jgi:hypothetical protein
MCCMSILCAVCCRSESEGSEDDEDQGAGNTLELSGAMEGDSDEPGAGCIVM